jgi:SAM-dependent methyltransferase
MRQLVKEFVQIVAEALPVPTPILEFGALQVPGQEGFADLRPIFSGKEYIGCDLKEGPGVDRILDLHHIDLPAETAGTVLLLDTLEHVEFFWQAVGEIRRILRPGGLFVVSSVMDFPIHNYPVDYWRFTPAGFRSLLQHFPCSFVGFAGEEDSPHTVVGLGFQEAAPSLEQFAVQYQEWQRRWRFPLGRGNWRTWARLGAPTGAILFYRQFLRRRSQAGSRGSGSG